MRGIAVLTVLFGTLCFATDGLGLGVIIGEPTGVSVKYWLGERVAVDAAGAWSLVGTPAMHLHGDIMIQHPEWMPVDYGEFAGFYGVGARLKLVAEDMRVGVRIPFGLEYFLEELPVGLFLELVPVVDLFPETRLRGNGAVGARYYFR